MTPTDNIKPWNKRKGKRYTEAQQWGNRLEFLTFLRKLPKHLLAPLEDLTRRGRHDPRTLPAGTPLCVADWCWLKYGAGLRGALGFGSGVVGKAVHKNDASWTPQGLAAYLYRIA